MKYSFPFIAGVILFAFSVHAESLKKSNPAAEDTVKRRESLELILKALPPDRINNGRVSFLDESFTDWLNRTGELPPDFDEMPSIPFPPNPLVLNEGKDETPITTMAQWEEKREWMKEQLKHYISGTFPPKPDNLKVKVLNERKDGDITLKMVELSFGPQHRAKLTLEVMIPPGKGKFPVFLTQWNHREWAQVAVRRGYIGCIYAGADAKDDTEEYSQIWAGEYDFTRLMRRAYGASRAVDYLFTLPEVDSCKIGITGHSRNGKQALMAAAFDERIAACIPSSGCSGEVIPWRYANYVYDIEDIALLSSARPSWLHPRLRFFIGRENKLPVDQNLFVALVAPRGLLMSTALSEGFNNPWAVEQTYHESKKVYDFLNAPDNLAIRSRNGLHSVSARDMEDYIDFFDYVFGRSSYQPPNRLYYDYSFESWKKLSGEQINPADYPVVDAESLLKTTSGRKLNATDDWEVKKKEIQENIRWGLGDEPAGLTNPGPGSLKKAGRGEVAFGTFLNRPEKTNRMGVMPVSPYNGFGDLLYGYLYYPLNEQGKLKNHNLPVIIYLHEFDYSKGFSSYHDVESVFQALVNNGFAVFSYDMIGFGNRIEEGTRFYDRYPHWSKMGKMVTDVKGAVDALSNIDFINPEKIAVAGYSLGATVGLYSAALDERISGVVSIAGFTPMRTNSLDRGTEGIKTYSHLHGLLPRLGFFVGKEKRIPYDYDEILAVIAPRKVLVIAPQYDKDAHHQDIIDCIKQSRQVYKMYGEPQNIQLFMPEDFNRFSPEMRNKMNQWFLDEFK